MTDDLRSRHIQLGHLLCQEGEAERLVEIYSSREARQRPHAAWEFLPLGWYAGKTLSALDALPVEVISKTASKRYEQRLSILNDRLRHMKRRVQAHLNEELSQHVH